MVSGISFGGLASGLDTETMISQLMQLERQPIVRFQQRQADLERVDKAWGDIVTRVSGFRTALDKVRDPFAWDGFVSATSSNSDAVGVTATTGAGDSSLTFTVTALAARHQVVAGDAGAHAESSSLVGAGEFTLTDASGTTTLATITTTATTTLAELAAQIDAADVGVDAQVMKVGEGDHRLVLEATDTGEAARFAITTDLAGMGTLEETSTGIDATLTMGGVTVRRASNTITDLVEGMTLELKATTASPVTVATQRDVSGAADAVEKLVTTANDLLGILATHTDYRGPDEASAALSGDAVARSLAPRLRALISDAVAGGTITHGSQLGIALTREGRVEIDRTKLEQALRDDFDAVGDFFGGSFEAPEDVRVTGTTSATAPGTYELTVDSAAAVASATGASFTPPGGNPKTFTITTSGGKTVSVTLDTSVMTVAQARAAIESQLAAAEVDTIQVTDDGNVLTFAETRAGSATWFEIADLGDGLDGRHEGVDIAAHLTDADGTYTLVGDGTSMRATDGPAAGMRLAYDGGATGLLGPVTFRGGLAGSLDDWMRGIEGSSGTVQSARDSLDSRIDDYDERILAFEERLEIREKTLRRQFTGLETALAQLQSQGQWLAGQLGGLTSQQAQ